MESEFSFKKLVVWQKAMKYVDSCFEITESINGHIRIKEQLESSSASVAQNIAEGEGRVSNKENIHYLYIARGSLYESITILNVLSERNYIAPERLMEMETLGMEIAKMLNKLIFSKRSFNA